MTPQPVLTEFVAAAAALLGLEVDDGWRDEIVANFKLLAAAAATIGEAPLSGDAEEASVAEA